MRAKYYAGFSPVLPVFVLPAEAENIERMVTQASDAIAKMPPKSSSEDLARAALEAIGVAIRTSPAPRKHTSP